MTLLLGQASLGSAWMLLWGIAAALPLLLHLWSRRRYRQVPWAAMEYLLAALRNDARRIRIQQLLLLAIRTAIPVVLAIALADPLLDLFPAWGTSLGQHRPRHILLVIDGSYSMDYRAENRSRFERAQQLAGDVVRTSRRGDGFTLILMAQPARVIISPPAFDESDVTTEIDSLQLQQTGADLNETLDRILRTLQTVQVSYPRLQEHLVFFFTDLGGNTWSTAATANARRQVAKIDAQASIVLVDVGSAQASNVAITDFEPSDGLAVIGRNLNFQATLRNSGTVNRTAHQVDLLADGRLVDRQSVDVAAGDDATVGFTYRFDAPGDHALETRLDTDALEVDNRRYLAIPVRTSLHVLCVSGKPGAARNVALALEPGASDRPLVETRIIAESLLPELDLEPYDCVFICNVGRLAREEYGVLRDFLHSGRGLVFFLGDQVQSENYNLELGGERSGQRLLPARIGPIAPQATYHFDPKDYGHPIVGPFRGHDSAGLLTTPVWRYFRLELDRQTQARVALWFDNGDPAIVEESIGGGRSILVATAGSEVSQSRQAQVTTPWTAWATWPSFPPLVQEMLARAVGTARESRKLLVGQELRARVRSPESDLTVTVSGGDGPERWEEQVRATPDDEGHEWTFGRTSHSGIYHVDYDAREIPSQLFAVNVDARRESDLDRVSIDDLPSQYQRENILVEEGQQKTNVVIDPSAAPLFRVILGVLLALLLLETFVAWYLGTARA